MAIIFTEGRAIVDRLTFDGLDISVEVKANSYRTGKDRTGKPWKQKVTAAYGYILGTNSPDGEHLDVWVKPKPIKNSKVFVIHQLSVDGTKYDEDKVMIGYPSKTEAIKAFKENCFKPALMYGGCSVFDMEYFKIIAYMASNSSVMIASQKMYDDFVEKGLLPKGIKSPIAAAKIVKENFSTADKSYITLTDSAEATRVFKLSSPEAKVVGNKMIFESCDVMKQFVQNINKPTNVIPMVKPTFGAIMERIDFYTGGNVKANVVDVIELDDKPFEYIMNIDLDRIVWRFTNTLIEFYDDAENILKFVADKACGGTDRYIRNYILSNFGCNPDEYAEIIREACETKIAFDTFKAMAEDTDSLHKSYSNVKSLSFKEICSGLDSF